MDYYSFKLIPLIVTFMLLWMDEYYLYKDLNLIDISDDKPLLHLMIILLCVHTLQTVFIERLFDE